jgi:fumarate reductase subunit D
MYRELNIKSVFEGHLMSFKGKNGKINKTEKFSYLYLPIFFSIYLGIFCPLNDGLKNIVSICISILIGLLFNLLILVLTNINTEKFINHSSSDRIIRVTLIKETFYNVCFSVIISIITLINLFLIDVLKFSTSFNDFLMIFFEINIDAYFQTILQIVLYFTFIQTFLVLFMIIKRIEKLFRVEIEQEIDIIKTKQKEELNQWDDV